MFFSLNGGALVALDYKTIDELKAKKEESVKAQIDSIEKHLENTIPEYDALYARLNPANETDPELSDNDKIKLYTLKRDIAAAKDRLEKLQSNAIPFEKIIEIPEAKEIEI